MTAPPITSTASYPGARRPDRSRWVASNGLRLAAYEWGDPEAPPLLLTHGGFDFAGTFDLLAPLLAEQGRRVVAWDQRGHGSSDHAVLYSWEADVRDAAAVLESLGSADPVAVLGHSKGGALMLQLAESIPHRVAKVVNLDGLPSARSWPDVPEHNRTSLLAGELTGWLDHRSRTADKQRRPGTPQELAARRREMNPRLSLEWLEYLVSVGAKEDPDGWRWRIDPTLRLGGFGPWRPEWSMWRLPALPMPVMAVLGLEVELMGWQTLPEDVHPYLPPGGRLIPLDGVGHFMHIEKPVVIADLVGEFL
jgi:pimeloyl-ACP methyl ester carboxylesterase